MAACRTACSDSREGITMSVAGTIRQMLGWCPDVSITGAREDERFNGTIVNAPEMPQKMKNMRNQNKKYILYVIQSIKMRGKT